MATTRTFRRHAAYGFSLLSLLIVILILAFLAALALPSLCRATEQSNRIKCASNLRQIGQAIELYRQSNNRKLPRTRADASADPIPIFYTAPTAPDPFAPDGPAPNDVTAALYLLIRAGEITPEVMLCPSGPHERDRQDPLKASNFASADSLSYGYQNPYTRPKPAARLPQIDPAEQVWAGDISPGGQELLTVAAGSPRTTVIRANSPNHAGDGQNVLYADLHVDWATTPFAGAPRQAGGSESSGGVRDNIYLAGGPGTPHPASLVAAPADALDTILLPVSRGGPASGAAAVRSVGGVRDIVWVYAGVAALVGVIAFVLIVRHRRKRRNPGTIVPGPAITSPTS